MSGKAKGEPKLGRNGEEAILSGIERQQGNRTRARRASSGGTKGGQAGVGPGLRSMACEEDAGGGYDQGFFQTISARQAEVLELLRRGFSNDEIAWELKIGTSTVETHVGRLCRRFGVRFRNQLIRRIERLEATKPGGNGQIQSAGRGVD